jgi:hypothetical protein
MFFVIEVLEVKDGNAGDWNRTSTKGEHVMPV